MLSDQEFRPGARPTRFDAELNCYIFKEGKEYHVRSKAAAGGRSDRWHNSGGAKAARDLPLSQPLVRRRARRRRRRLEPPLLAVMLARELLQSRRRLQLLHPRLLLRRQPFRPSLFQLPQLLGVR